jgi:hypothetical protein
MSSEQRLGLELFVSGTFLEAFKLGRYGNATEWERRVPKGNVEDVFE